MKLAQVIAIFEKEVPKGYQEDYDNTGLAVGMPDMDVHGALLCIDVTGAVIEEAIQWGANLIISHHPVLFSPLKKITGSTYTERIVAAAIKNNIALYSAHTNLDNLPQGVNQKICEKLGVLRPRILLPLQSTLRKLVTFVPAAHADKVRTALFAAGAGSIGNYDQCSFNSDGMGSFRASADTNPFAGEKGKLHFEAEVKIETVFPAPLQKEIVKALVLNHPYEEVAYDIFKLENSYEKAGAGMIGELAESVDEKEFLEHVKSIFHCGMIKHSPLLDRPVSSVAVCGGSGSFLIRQAIHEGADMFITADVKYHQFFDADNRIVIADIGHYESEQYTIELFYEILTKKITNFAIRFSSINPNCINYL
jgi:dinuclear metal center YbgI/SA1388 family protein